MGVSERQASMLKEMGIRVWSRPADAPDATDPTPVVQAVVPAARQSVAVDRPSARGAEDAPTAAAPRPVTREAVPVTVVARAPQAEGGLAALDWPALRDTVANCTACPLCEERTQTVFGAGQTRADWMIVGEAPGEAEDRDGEPFVGKSGQLLDNMLKALGLGRGPGDLTHQVYVTNAVKCRPPSDRSPQAAELTRCEPYLARQIALVQPRVIVAMGRFAVQSLLRSQEPIGRLRQRVHAFEGVPLVVTYHPTYLLRNPEDKGRAWDDLCLAREVLAGIG